MQFCFIRNYTQIVATTTMSYKRYTVLSSQPEYSVVGAVYMMDNMFVVCV